MLDLAPAFRAVGTVLVLLNFLDMLASLRHRHSYSLNGPTPGLEAYRGKHVSKIVARLL